MSCILMFIYFFKYIIFSNTLHIKVQPCCLYSQQTSHHYNITSRRKMLISTIPLKKIKLVAPSLFSFINLLIYIKENRWRHQLNGFHKGVEFYPKEFLCKKYIFQNLTYVTFNNSFEPIELVVPSVFSFINLLIYIKENRWRHKLNCFPVECKIDP